LSRANYPTNSGCQAVYARNQAKFVDTTAEVA
jgi:hypothetical protein